MKRYLLVILSLLCISANAEDFPPKWGPWDPFDEPTQQQRCSGIAPNYPSLGIKLFKEYDPITKREGMTCRGYAEGVPFDFGGYSFRYPSCADYPGSTLVYENGAMICRGPNPCQDKVGKVAASGLFLQGTAAYFDQHPNAPIPNTSSRCSNSCSVYVAPPLDASGHENYSCINGVVNGVRNVYCRLTYVYNGESCKSGQAPVPGGLAGDEAPPKSCDPTKQDKINLNGKDICVDRQTGKEVNPTTGEQADGNKNTEKDVKKDKTPDNKDRTTETERIKNPDGSVTERKTETVCDAAGNCKTSTTEHTTGKGDSETNKDPDNDKQDDFCKKNPNKKICEEKNKFNDGNCPTPPSCEGDAIQCGIAQKVHKANCDADKRHKDMYESDAANQGYSTYNGMKAENGAAGNSKGSAIGIREINFGNGSGSLNWDAFQPSGTCPFIRSTVTLPGSRFIPGITTDFDPTILCQYGPALSRIIILSTMLACAFMFMRKI